MIGLGTALNVIGILAGGVLGLWRRKPFSLATESWFKVTLGVCTVFYGLRLTCLSLDWSFPRILKQLLVTIVAMMLGKVMGRVLQLQKMSNRLGQGARETIVAARPEALHRWGDGFRTCAKLFCAAPLAILGAVQDGLSGYFYPLGVKAVMDGLATIGFIGVFGWGVMVAALPVLAFQGTLWLICALYLKPMLAAHGLLNSVNAVGGLLVFCVALVILGLRRIELADYLPSLAIAPLLTWVWP
jgi:uncharacterized protein